MILAGCGIGPVTHSTSGTLAISGQVHGGQQPVAQSSIQLYTVGKAGNGSMAKAMLTVVRSSQGDGSFSITGDYNCGSTDDQVYLVASGGNPGLAKGTNNPALVMMTALGSCGDLSSATYIKINEVTTAAAVWALAPFIASATNIGASSTNAKGIASAFLNEQLLVDNNTGLAATLGSNLSTETMKLYALANALAPCVNSTGTTGCATLFAAANVTAGSSSGNTLNAALNIVRHPGGNVMAVFQASNSEAPFPTTAVQPHDWTMSLTITGGGLNSPTMLGVDGFNNVWVANYPGSLSVFSAQGTAFSGAPFGVGKLSESYGLAIDPSNNIWVTNEQQPNHYPTQGSVTAFLGAGSGTPGSLLNGANSYSDVSVDFPLSVAADTDGRILIADYASSSVTIYTDSGNYVESGVASGSASLPVAIAPDLAHGLWLADEGNNSVTHVASNGTVLAYFQCCGGANGVATDKFGNAWISNYYGGTLSEISPAAGTTAVTTTATGGGMTDNAPSGIAVDASQNVWVANYYGANFSEVAGNGGTPAAGSAISPSAGYGLDAGLLEPFQITPDAAGNLWISNFGKNTLTMFFGLATPTKTPLIPAPTAP
jgi:streptogramin lyase